MKSDTYRKYGVASLVVLCVAIASCTQDATTWRTDEQQGSGPMGSMGRGGPPQGKPPALDHDKSAELELPAEAFAACAGKNSGDEVRFTLQNGILLEATCTVVDDHLVAVPQLKAQRKNYADG